MEKMSINSIGSISKNFFRTTPSKVENNQTNPFGVSFKGNVLTADVFETKSNLIEKVSNKSKMVSSAVVGSISDFGNAMGARLNSIVSFGRRIKDNATTVWDRARNIEINMAGVKRVLNTDMSILTNSNYNVKNLMKLPVADLEVMLKEAIVII